MHIHIQQEAAKDDDAGRALMAECGAWFHPEHFVAVVEELASLVSAGGPQGSDRRCGGDSDSARLVTTPETPQGQCGYPPCRRALGEDRLSLRPGQKRIDAKEKRIVDVTKETTMVRFGLVRDRDGTCGFLTGGVRAFLSYHYPNPNSSAATPASWRRGAS